MTITMLSLLALAQIAEAGDCVVAPVWPPDNWTTDQSPEFQWVASGDCSGGFRVKVSEATHDGVARVARLVFRRNGLISTTHVRADESLWDDMWTESTAVGGLYWWVTGYDAAGKASRAPWEKAMWLNIEDDQDDDRSSLEDGDCNDADPLVFPGQDEACDGDDDNCNGTIDEDCIHPY